jgi:3-oxoacyl-[acyl-carrier-protein] synthase-3
MSPFASSAGAQHAAILGIGGYRPSRVIPNSEVIAAIDSSDEWIQQRSGIKQRRWATPEETVQVMAVAAARKALEHADIDARQIDAVIVATVSHMLQTPAIATAIAYDLGTDQAGISAEQIDCVIVATVSHMLQTPAIATAIAHELGTNKASAFDISAACAGFCYGVALASDMVRGGSVGHALVIGVERLSDLTDLHDRGTAFIFADGAGAAVVGPSDQPGIGPVVWGSDGEQFDLIRQKEDWRDVVGTPDQPGTGVMPHLMMQGNPVFRWASFAMAKVGQQALDRAGVSIDDLDVFVPHQANMRIIDAMARSMKLPERVKIARDIAEQGNTSAASIPLALDRMIAEGDAKSGDIALLIAFGAGLAYAAQVVTVP